MEGGETEKAPQQASSYTYWVRETTTDAAPLPVPRRISPQEEAKNTNLGSVWNQAGTWEEKNLNTWASNRIKELLVSLDCVEFTNGKASIHEVSKCSGDAFLVTVRNKKRVGYTYEVTLKFKGEWMIQEENKKVKGHIDLPEFTFGELDELQIDVRLSEAKDMAAEDKTRIVKDIKSLLPAIRDKLLKFEEELKDR